MTPISKTAITPRTVEPKEQEPSVNKHLRAVDERIAVVSAEICKQMYVDTIEEALALASTSHVRHDAHVATLNDERAELTFLKLRRAQLAAVGAA